MNILAITYAFVPLRFPATFRLLKWFKYLDEAGHRVTVVSVDPDSFVGPKDATIGRLIPPHVHNVMARSRESDLLHRILKRAEPCLWPLFQPHKREWFGPARKKIHQLPLDTFDVIFSCSQPPVCHLLGAEVKSVTGLPWVAYFSDPWSDNPYHATVAPRIRRYNRRLEEKVIHGCDRVVFSTEETKQLVMDKYPGELRRKADTLDHCYVPDWFELRTVEGTTSSGVLRILLTGNFYGPRTPIPFLERLVHLGGASRFAGKLLFEFFGGMSASDRTHKIWPIVEEFARHRGSVSYLESLALMRNADHLLLLDAALETKSGSVFFPSKLVEYIGSGRPIIGVTPENSASARILREIGCPVVDPGRPEALDDLLTKLVARSAPREPDLTNREQYHYRTVGQHLVDILLAATASERTE